MLELYFALLAIVFYIGAALLFIKVLFLPFKLLIRFFAGLFKAL